MLLNGHIDMPVNKLHISMFGVQGFIFLVLHVYDWIAYYQLQLPVWETLV